jgi:phosphoglycolate phosphatase
LTQDGRPGVAAVPGDRAYRLVMFDFDGTLADSLPFFHGVFEALAVRHGLAPMAAADLPALRRMPVASALARLGIPRWKLPLVLRDGVARMRADGQGVRLFDGMGAVLDGLAARGAVLAVVSSNARDNVLRTLGPRHAAQFRHVECGMSIFGKAPRIRQVLRRAGCASQDALFIGDTESDLAAARSAGVAFGAVAWGYGDIASLARAEHAFRTPEELREHLADRRRHDHQRPPR